MKKTLMIIAMVAIVAITGVLIYYYVFFRTGIEKAEIRIQEQKATEETLRKENLEKCLKEANDWYKEARGRVLSGDFNMAQFERLMKIVREEYQDRVDTCNMLYGK